MNSNLSRMSQNDINETLNHFIKLYTSTLEQRTESEREEIKKFTDSVELMIPVFSLRPDRIQEIYDKIFMSTEVTNFIFDLSFVFFTTFGNIENPIEKLVCNLCDGLTLDTNEPEYCMVPYRTLSSTASLLLSGTDEKKTSFSLWLNRMFFRKNNKVLPTLDKVLLNNKPLIITYLIYLSFR